MKSKNRISDYRLTRKCKKSFVEKGYEMNLDKITIKKGEPFTVNGKKLVLDKDTKIDRKEQGYFILSMQDQCEIEDIDIFPAKYIVCESLQERSVLQYNVLIGGTKDLCLN